ncbi:NB-ARC domain-containing protein [Streptomyces sp. CA-253872]|uniref:NB-ARC domain-containing protein n=1 Tax=Streptomyces sp. CA-253872 TaxID=3240067 RepID=UPI003D8EAFA7
MTAPEDEPGAEAAAPWGNGVSGTVNGTVIQAGRVHGGITVVTGASAPERVVPDQIPPLTVPFVNRRAELALLAADSAPRPHEGEPPGEGSEPHGDEDDLVGDRDAVEVGYRVFFGLPGVGKTALVRKWGRARGTRDRFPDGQLFVDYAGLRGVDGDSAIALARCLRELGVKEEFIPHTLEDRAALYRHHTAGRRLLVVVDDALKAAQVRPLLPQGAGSMLLVTSTRRLGELTLDGARLTPMAPLDADAALRLLADRLGPETVHAHREAALSVVAACGGLPKALDLAAVRLLQRPHLTLPALARELARESNRLRGLALRGGPAMSTVLELTYGELSQEEAGLYRLLGVLPGRTCEPVTVAAGLGLAAQGGEGEAAELLERLFDAGLLDAAEGGHYRMHDLVRAHAREKAGEVEGARWADGVVERVTRALLLRTAQADRALREDRLRVAVLDELLAQAPDPFADGAERERAKRALAWLEAGKYNTLAVLAAAEALGLHGLVWPLAEAQTALFLHHRHVREWLTSLETGARAAAADLAPAGEARLRSLLSRPLLDLGEDERARAELERAAACAEVAASPVLSASVLEFSGRYWDRADPERAVGVYARAVELNAEAGEERGGALAEFFLGRALVATGRAAEALPVLERARDVLRGLGEDDRRMAARAGAALGDAREALGDLAGAERELREAAGELRAVDATYYEAQARERLAGLMVREGHLTAARAEALRAYTIYEEGGSPEAGRLRVRMAALLGEDVVAGE